MTPVQFRTCATAPRVPETLVGFVRAASARSGLPGLAAPLVNAVYHATGQRVRDLPITVEKLLA